MAHRSIAIAIVSLLITLPAIAEEKYTIRIKVPAVGETIRVEKEETQSIHLTAYDNLGRKLLDRQEKLVDKYVYRETILERTAKGELTQLRRLYEKAQETKNQTFRNLALNRLAVLIKQQQGGKYRFVSEGGQELSPKDAVPLDQEFNSGDEKFRIGNLIPVKPIGVDSPWSFDMQPLVKDLTRTGRFATDGKQATGIGYLNKTTLSDNARFGQILCRLEIPIQAMIMTGPDRQSVLPSSRAKFELTLDLCIDGKRLNATFLSKGTVKATANLPQPDGSVGRLTYELESDSHEVRTPVEKKPSK